jgi:hypothetical protein
MAPKPIVVFVSSDGNLESDDSYHARALVYYLNVHCGCSVHIYCYSQDLAKNAIGLTKLVTSGKVICFFVQQDRYLIDDHVKVISEVRKSISLSVPILIQEDHRAEEKVTVETDSNVYLFDDESDVIKKIDELKLTWQPRAVPPDYFDIRTSDELAFLCSRFVTAYDANLGDDPDANLLGPVDYNHRLVTQALRMRLLPSSLLKGEFDDVVHVPPPVTSLPKVDSVTYAIELERIRTMDAVERKKFYHSLLHATGCAPAEGGGIWKMEVSSGNNNLGFAIDALTLHSAKTVGFGSHALAQELLKFELEIIESLRKRHCGIAETSDERVGRYIIPGLIVMSLEGFATPILMLYQPFGENTELFHKVAKYIIELGQCIPVYADGIPVIP